MSRLLATRSADPRFKNVHSLGLGSYIARTRELLCSARATVTVVSPWIDRDGIRFLLECWEDREHHDAEWNLFVRRADRPLVQAARDKAWRLHQYERLPASRGPPFGMHAKLVLADEAAAAVGSMNLLRASLYSNLEIGVDVDDRVMARQLARVAARLEDVSTVVRT